jgi:hypothetical protein
MIPVIHHFNSDLSTLSFNFSITFSLWSEKLSFNTEKSELNLSLILSKRSIVEVDE